MSVIDTSQSGLNAGGITALRSGQQGMRTKELSEEEKQRLDQLKNMLTDMLAETEGQPSDEQRARIREIENEIAKITGERPRRSLAATTARLPLKRKDQDKEDDAVQSPFLVQERVAEATLPKEKPIKGEGSLAGPLKNAAATYEGLTDQGNLIPAGVVTGYGASGRTLSSAGAEALSSGLLLNRSV